MFFVLVLRVEMIISDLGIFKGIIIDKYREKISDPGKSDLRMVVTYRTGH